VINYSSKLALFVLLGNVVTASPNQDSEVLYSSSQWVETQDGTMPVCINNSGGIKTGILLSKLISQSSWRPSLYDYHNHNDQKCVELKSSTVEVLLIWTIVVPS